MESILMSVKYFLGLTEEYKVFDPQIIMHINSVFTVLHQLGVGPKKEFSIEGNEEKWSDFFGESDELNLVKSYMYLKVKLLFDPPNTGVLHEAMERQIAEFEWRLNVAVDPKTEEDDEDGSV